MTPFGIHEDILERIIAHFRQFPAVQKVVIFGSRARGDFKPGADVDIAVYAPGMPTEEFGRLWNRLDDEPVIFTLDVVHADRVTSSALRERIDRDAKVVYQAA